MELILLVGPPGSGKSTFRQQYPKHTHINQDELGKDQHLIVFNNALEAKHDIIIDRMNFSKQQRERYLKPAKEAGYTTKIIVLYENYQTCLNRCITRENHPTIKDEVTAKKVLNFFYSKYEPCEDSEANEVIRQYPEGLKEKVVICDLDGTLCNIDHRLHFVRREGKKDWKSFFEGLVNDTPNLWCLDLVKNSSTKVIFCSGRTNNYRKLTKEWINKYYPYVYDLYMRFEGDFRQDNIVKSNLLDFEILTRYTPYFFIDDRKQVVDMWRSRGFVCLACAEGNF